ncbi:hypothetical protein NPX79_02240 [Spiroplasma endosymbiont of Anurida maritima]|uniref:hypothetical protein n=1 Tax=Spiroplasma endosymbiont of Anurida maritima TaxID=2967972 RepID=UPI0036D28189
MFWQKTFPDQDKYLEKAKELGQPFYLNLDFKVNFQFKSPEGLIQDYSSQNTVVNSYFVKDIVLFEDIIDWIQQDLPNYQDKLANFAITEDDFTGVSAFSDTSRLHDSASDLVNRLKEAFGENVDKLEFTNMTYNSNIFDNKDMFSPTNGMIYRTHSYLLSYNDPLENAMSTPIFTNETTMANVAAYNDMNATDNYDWFWTGENDYGDKDEFVKNFLYGTAQDVQTIVDQEDNNGVLGMAQPGVLSYDRNYNTGYTFKYEGKAMETGAGLDVKYHEPLKEFYSKNIDKNFLNEETKNQIKVQDDYVITSGANPGIFTDTTVVDAGTSGILSWTYEGLPLPKIDNISTFILTNEAKTLNDNYKEVGALAYDLFIQGVEGGKATSILSNMFDNSFAQVNVDQSYAGTSHRGASYLKLSEEDFDIIAGDTSKNGNINKVIPAFVEKQLENVDNPLKGELNVSYDYNTLQEVNLTDIQSADSNSSIIAANLENLENNDSNYIQRMGSFFHNPVVYIGQFGFALNSFNYFLEDEQAAKDSMRFNLGTNEIILAKNTKTSAYHGYTGSLFS